MLEVCRIFFDRLNQDGVRYCQWKSNSHLDAGLNGKTDLDLLVHPGDQAAFEAALALCDFKRILSPPSKRFPGFEDYLGFDAATGRFVHVHLHYSLIMGRKYIKDLHLPLESLYFANLTRKSGVNIPCAELELIMLIMRAHLKTDYLSILKHAIKSLMGAKYTAFPPDIEDELTNLIATSDMDRVVKLMGESGLPLDFTWCRQFMDRFVSGRLKWFQILAGHYHVRRLLKPYRRMTGFGVQLEYFRHFLLNTDLGGRLAPSQKKTLPDGGRVFSVIGADGSGKSTLIADLKKWLSWKLVTKQYYYGIPKDAVRFVARTAMTGFSKLKLRGLERLTFNMLSLHVARQRREVSRQSRVEVDAGRVVITDRFPLPDFKGMPQPMDNPRIDPTATLFGRNLRKTEEACYTDLRFPDLAIVLQVDIEELRRRKTDLSRALHETKADAVNAIRPRERLVTIDANRPYADVLLDVKRLIWKAL
jgi:thymidylate kinase